MLKLKKYGKVIGFFLLSLVLYLLLLTTLNYTGLIKYASIVKLNFIIVAIITLVFGIMNGQMSLKKGYIEGLKLGGIIVLILFILNLILYRKFSLSIFTYYLIIIISSTIGSIVGINFRKK